MPDRAIARSFLPLKYDVLLILLALAGEPRHGYAIIRDVDERTDGDVVLQSGALYRTLKRLLGDALIEETAAPAGEASEDERRRYYTLTRLGRAVVAAEIERLARLVKDARIAVPNRKPRLA